MVYKPTYIWGALSCMNQNGQFDKAEAMTMVDWGLICQHPENQPHMGNLQSLMLMHLMLIQDG